MLFMLHLLVFIYNEADFVPRVNEAPLLLPVLMCFPHTLIQNKFAVRNCWKDLNVNIGCNNDTNTKLYPKYLYFK